MFSLTEPPTFTSLYYTGTYNIVDNEKHEITTQAILISEDYSDYPTIELELTGDYSSHFRAELNERTVVVSLDTNLDSEVIMEQSILTLEIVATVKDNTALAGSTVLIITLPTIEDPGNRNHHHIPKFVISTTWDYAFVYRSTKFHKSLLHWHLQRCG